MKSIETTLAYTEQSFHCGSFTMVQCAAFGCNNKSTNPCVEGSGTVHSFHFFLIKWLY